ncbi:MAG TPA: hypothetical protein VM536_11120 [Chloroflexia bacterium]|nr:hypothetical protein [Chloroflexia bacterium]
MAYRVLSCAMFLFSLLVMALGATTISFGITDVGYVVAAIMAVFGYVLCLVSYFALAAGAGVGSEDPQWYAYGIITFLFGFIQLAISLFAILFAITVMTTWQGFVSAGAGLVLCLTSYLLVWGGVGARRSILEEESPI